MKTHAVALTHSSAALVPRTEEGSICNKIYFAGTKRSNDMTIIQIGLMDLVKLLGDVVQHTPDSFMANRFVPAVTVPGYDIEIRKVSGTDGKHLGLYIVQGRCQIYIGKSDDGIPGILEVVSNIKDMAAELLELSINGIGNFEKTLSSREFDSKFKAKWYSDGDLDSMQWVGNTFSVSNWNVRNGRPCVEIISGMNTFSYRIHHHHFPEIKELINDCYQTPSGKLISKEFKDGMWVFVSKVPYVGGGDIINLIVIDRFGSSSLKIRATDWHMQILMDAFTVDMSLPGLNDKDL